MKQSTARLIWALLLGIGLGVALMSAMKPTLQQMLPDEAVSVRFDSSVQFLTGNSYELIVNRVLHGDTLEFYLFNDASGLMEFQIYPERYADSTIMVLKEHLELVELEPEER